MRKRLITLLIVTLLAASITACENKIPDGMSQETYDVGVTALEIMDKYNSADIDADEADSRLDTLYSKLNSLDLNDEPESEYGLSEDSQNGFVKTCISAFQWDLISGGDTYETADNLRDTLDIK